MSPEKVWQGLNLIMSISFYNSAFNHTTAKNKNIPDKPKKPAFGAVHYDEMMKEIEKRRGKDAPLGQGFGLFMEKLRAVYEHIVEEKPDKSLKKVKVEQFTPTSRRESVVTFATVSLDGEHTLHLRRLNRGSVVVDMERLGNNFSTTLRRCKVDKAEEFPPGIEFVNRHRMTTRILNKLEELTEQRRVRAENAARKQERTVMEDFFDVYLNPTKVKRRKTTKRRT